MAKQRIDVTIDHDIWFYYRANKINVSSVVNDLLRMKMDMKENNKEIITIQEDLTKITESIKEQNQKRDELYIMLVTAKEQEAQQAVEDKKASAERLQRIKMTARSIQRSRRFQDGKALN